jgi:hypothetical protein
MRHDGTTKLNGSTKLMITKPIAAVQKTVAVERSVAAIRRVINIAADQHSAEAMTRKAAGGNAALPGRTTTNTPVKPTKTPAQPRIPTVSPSIGAERATTNSGEAELMVVAWAIGNRASAKINSTAEPATAAPRTLCHMGRRVLMLATPPRKVALPANRVKTIYLTQAISIGGNELVKNFAVVSESEKHMVAAQSKIIPRNGRSMVPPPFRTRVSLL